MSNKKRNKLTKSRAEAVLEFKSALLNHFEVDNEAMVDINVFTEDYVAGIHLNQKYGRLLSKEKRVETPVIIDREPWWKRLLGLD